VLFKLAVFTMGQVMRLALIPMLLIASPASAQPVPTAPMAPVAPITPTPWLPTAPYVIVGQDEPGYRNWYIAARWHPAYVKAFNDYLTTYGVGGVVPTWQLLRTASDWQKCGAPAFEVPPTNEWPNIVQTLRYIRDKVIPAIGPVEPVSVYRNPALNQCAGGAAESAHRYTQAVDLVPLTPITRDALMQRLCAVHARDGEGYGVGLGFYPWLRFHIDSRRYRKWGHSDAVPACRVEIPRADPIAAAPAPTVPPGPAATSTRQP
jgi:hypothetical protein